MDCSFGLERTRTQVRSNRPGITDSTQDSSQGIYDGNFYNQTEFGRCRNRRTRARTRTWNLKKSGHWRIFVVSKLLYFEVRKVEMFGLFEYLINPPKVEMPRMVKASPILFHFKFHSRSPCFYLEYISFLGWKKFLLSILLSRNKIKPNLFKNHLFTYFRCRFREKSHSDLLQKLKNWSAWFMNDIPNKK